MSIALSTVNQTIVIPLFDQAKSIYAEIIEAESALRLQRDELLVLAFHLGKVLTALKEEIGHGKWLFWLGGHWPQLGERNAQRCMALFRDNPDLAAAKSVDSSDLNSDSIRKFMWSYIPEKERPQLENDEEVKREPHYLSFTNHFSKWNRMRKLGRLSHPPSQDQFRREIAPTLMEIIEIAGRDWFLELLESN